jgi:hypothetical protein
MVISFKKLRDFSEEMTMDTVIDDLVKNYTIKNICDDDGESVCYLAEALLEDYTTSKANYKAYIEKDMDARLLMEIRKSAVIPFGEQFTDFYEKHSTLKTAKEVKEFRTQYIHAMNDDYIEKNWQYYYLIKFFWKGRAKYFCFDFESCFADGDWRKQTNPEDYQEEMLYDRRIPDDAFY